MIPQNKATQAWDELPKWVVFERQLIDVMNASPDEFIRKHLKNDGWYRYDSRGKLDDSYEPFHNQPTFYALGGNDRFPSLARRQWEFVTRCFTETGVVVDEFHGCDDRIHPGEGRQLFYSLCLADPLDSQTIARHSDLRTFTSKKSQCAEL